MEWVKEVNKKFDDMGNRSSEERLNKACMLTWRRGGEDVPFVFKEKALFCIIPVL